MVELLCIVCEMFGLWYSCLSSLVRLCFCFFQAEDGIRCLVRSGGLGDVYKRQLKQWVGGLHGGQGSNAWVVAPKRSLTRKAVLANDCLLYTSDAADDLLCVDLGGRRIIKKK